MAFSLIFGALLSASFFASASAAPGNVSSTNSVTPSSNVPVARIVGGEELGVTPSWLASLRYPNAEGQLVHICGGSLIAERWVLTAGHCMKEPVQSLEVWLGGNRLDDVDAYDKYHVESAHQHEGWTNEYLNDLMLLKLDRPATTTATGDRCGYRRPIVLNHDQNVTEGLELDIAGWGVTEFGASTLPGTLRHAKVPVVSLDTCLPMSPGLITDMQFCAGYAEGRIDACTGDSGGPAYTQKAYGADQLQSDNPPDIQWGITSWGVGCAQRDKYGVYVDVAEYADWIENTMRPDQPYNGDLTIHQLELSSYAGEELSSGSGAAVQPAVYLSFNCTLDCPVERSTSALALNNESPLACPAANETVPVGPLTVNVSLLIGSDEHNGSVSTSDATVVTCRSAEQFCSEIDMQLNEGGYCERPGIPLATAQPTLCRVDLGRLFPDVAMDSSWTVTRLAVFDNSRELQNERLTQRPALSGLLGQWELARPTEEIELRSTVGEEEAGDDVAARHNSSKVAVTKSVVVVERVDGPGGTLQGTWERMQDETEAKGELYCVQQATFDSHYLYGCTLLREPTDATLPMGENMVFAFARNTHGQAAALHSSTNQQQMIGNTTLLLRLGSADYIHSDKHPAIGPV